ncbi:MAG: 16S rRNA (cytidine(1402)-2'-O)-methyltransferase [Spirochaetaceae bacterium]
MASLYIVATPIGNLKDITLRALETLGRVDVIACEDTRHTRKLLTHYEISSRLVSIRSENEREGAEKLIETLREGKDAAYVSDAGTPGVSDPGRRVVEAVRAAGFSLVPIPGPSALTTLLSVSSFPGRTVTFDGFISPKAGKRAKRIGELLAREESFIFYESPHRVLKILKDVAEKEPERPVIIGREMTKIYEEFLEGTAEEVYFLLENRKSLKGEFSLLVSGKKKR